MILYLETQSDFLENFLIVFFNGTVTTILIQSSQAYA